MRPHRMCLYFLLPILWALMTGGTFTSRNPMCFPGNSLDHQEILQYATNGETMIHLYSVEKHSEGDTFGKSYTIMTENSDGTIKYINYSNNESQGECVLLFDSPNMVVTERKQKKRVKGKRGYVLDSFATLRSSEVELRLYSQDPEKYYWVHICTEGYTATYDTCGFGFVDLVIHDIRPGMTGDVDLTGLPWSKIAADVEAITGVKIGDPEMKYIWKGLECLPEDVGL